MLATTEATNLRRLYLRDTAVGEYQAYLAIWGNAKQRDSYDTWFDRAAPPEMAIEFLPFPLLLEHGGEPGIGIEIIGSVRRIWFDDIGIACSGYLDQAHPLFERTKERIRNGELFTSTASGAHVADWDEEGRFVKWLLVELSLTDSPAESRMPSVKLIRSDKTLTFVLQAEGERDALSEQGAMGEANHSLSIRGDYPMFGNNPSGVGQPPAQPAPLPTPPPIAPTQPAQPAPPAQTTPPARTPLEQLLVDPNTPVEAIISGILESGAMTPEELMMMLQQMGQPAPAPTESLSSNARVEPDEDEASRTRSIAALLQQVFAGRSGQPQPRQPQPGQGNNDVLRLKLENELLRRRQQSQQSAPPAGNPSPVQRGGAGFGSSRGGRITGFVDRRYDHLTAEEMALGYMVMEQAIRSGGMDTDISEEYVKVMAYKLGYAMDRNDPRYDRAAIDPVVMRSFPLQGRGTTRANEAMQSTLANFGDEWVYDYQGTSLWESVRQETLIYQEALRRGMDEKEIPQGYESETIPLEGADPTWYVAAQTTDYDTSSGMMTPKFSPSKFGTAKKNVTVAKLSCAIPITGELEEDSIIGVVQEANRKLRVSANEQIEFIFLNGDTAAGATTNINYIDGTPPTAPTMPAFMLLNGVLKLPLVTNTAMSRDASTTFDETDFLATFKLLPKNLRQNRQRLMFVLDADTMIAASNIASLKTRDVAGTAATLFEGVLTSIYRIDVFETGFMELANSAGKVTSTIDGTLGRLLCFRADQWASRWKRRMRVEVERYAMSDSRMFVGHLRWGIAARATNVAAVSYNVPVTLS